MYEDEFVENLYHYAATYLHKASENIRCALHIAKLCQIDEEQDISFATADAIDAAIKDVQSWLSELQKVTEELKGRS